ncbi:MAG: CHAT domain-containing protein [Bacteroidota bacterium]
MESIKPTILLAFADSRNDLPELVNERRSLEDMLTAKFNVQSRDAMTHRRMDQFFREEGHRLRVFHFGGHANGKQLAFLSETGDSAAAYVRGVASLVGKQKGIALVFLNGCSTQGQVETYLKEKLPAVIATTAPVSDSVAQQFASAFYKNFIAREGRCPLREAFEQAKS